MYFQRNKYYQAKKVSVGNKHYDSKFEGEYGFELELRKIAGEIKDFKTHQQISLEVNGYKICDYYIDFIIEHNDGTLEYVETKGWMTGVWKIKWKIFEALYSEKPGVKLSVVLQSNSRLRIPKARKIK